MDFNRKKHGSQSPEAAESLAHSRTAIFGGNALLVLPNISTTQIFDIGFHLLVLVAHFSRSCGSDFPPKTSTNPLRDPLRICLRFQWNGPQ